MRIITPILLLVLAEPIPADEPTIHRGLPYAEPKNERQMLDVYTPAKKGKDQPVVLWIHGGGWRAGDKANVHKKPQAFVDKGFVFVSTNHRFFPSVTVKEMTGDIAKAIRWVHDHAKEYGGDPKSIFVMGHSSGAHLAALVCTDDRYLKAEGLPLSIIKGCVPVDVSVYDIPKRLKDGAGAIFQKTFGEKEESQRELSPVTHAAKGKDIPPFLILHVADRPETKTQSHGFADKLKAAGVTAKVVAAEGTNHGTINTNLGLPKDRPTEAMWEFMTRALKDKQDIDAPSAQQFLLFIKAQAAQMRAKDQPPKTRAEWDARREDLRRNLQKAFGPFPAKPCPLEPKVLGVIKRDGYRIERIIFQTMPGVWMTANAYVPDGPGKHPALLAVHGHWRGARLDPVVQRRCIGPAKLGFFVLAVDAFGAGERGVGTKLGEYHGEMTAATLFPAGLTLSGLQVYENMRAVDYLLTRKEVDGSKIGITGASGGGNQTMYAGAWDDRFSAVVPVCSVGNYQAYLGPACCMCEVVPGALRFTEEWGVLGMTAPRGLMVVNATKDGIQFSVGEAKKSLAVASAVYKLYDKPASLRHTIFDWHHDYSQAMREALYGWLTLHLKGKGDGSPIKEPEIKTEDPETLRCFPGDSRPADWMTIPRFAAAEGRKFLKERKVPESAEAWNAEAKRRRQALVDNVFGGFPEQGGGIVGVTGNPSRRTVTFEPEPGLTLSARHDFLARALKKGISKMGVAILLDLDGADKAAASPLHSALGDAGWTVITIDLRATGKLARPNETVGRAPDHHSAEWSLWIGRPLLGQWVWDVRQLLDTLNSVDKGLPKRLAVIGRGPAGLVALSAAAVDPRITHVATVDALASYISDVPYQGQRLGVMAPGILREVGDVSHLAALCAPRRVVIAGGVWGDGKAGTSNAFAVSVWSLLGARGELRLMPSKDVAQIVDGLK